VVAAVEALNALGGLAELEERADGFVIRSDDCPLAAVVPGHPEACHLAAALVSEVAGVEARACCARTPTGDAGRPPRCCFEVGGA
jgi:predicted ArsR family transcriptional regulator